MKKRIAKKILVCCHRNNYSKEQLLNAYGKACKVIIDRCFLRHKNKIDLLLFLNQYYQSAIFNKIDWNDFINYIKNCDFVNNVKVCDLKDDEITVEYELAGYIRKIEVDIDINFN